MARISMEDAMATRKAATKAAPPAAPVKPARKTSKPDVKAAPKPRAPKPEGVQRFTGTEPGAQDLSTTDEQKEMGLRPTGTPGVFLNRSGQMVDADGILLTYGQVKGKDDARWERIIGEPVDTPAKLLKAVTLDPQQTLMTRLDAAKAAAPYFDRKKPIGIDGGSDGKPIEVLHRHKLVGMSQEELDDFERMLKLTGTSLIGGEDDGQAQA